MRKLVAFLLFSFCAFVICIHAQSVSPSSALLVANQGDRTLSVIDPQVGKQLGIVHENAADGWVHELAASPDGRTVFAPVYGNSGVGKPGTDGRNLLVVDIASRKIIGNVDFGHGVRPHCAVYDPASGLLYVTTELDQISGRAPSRARDDPRDVQPGLD
jgi:DNA-binding beta-propeller fold protein YncE